MPSIETQESMLHRVEQVQLALYVHPVLDKGKNKFNVFFFQTREFNSTLYGQKQNNRPLHVQVTKIILIIL